jgi:hypothetical protein
MSGDGLVNWCGAEFGENPGQGHESRLVVGRPHRGSRSPMKLHRSLGSNVRSAYRTPDDSTCLPTSSPCVRCELADRSGEKHWGVRVPPVVCRSQVESMGGMKLVWGDQFMLWCDVRPYFTRGWDVVR